MSVRAKSGATTAIVVVAIAANLWGLLAVLSSPFELTRLRNSFIAATGDVTEFDWNPAEPPEDFVVEASAPPGQFVEAVRASLGPKGTGQDAFSKALRLARHLASGPGPGEGGIQSDTLTTYSAIMTENRGYCADYSQVFNGMGIAVGVPVREWGMSFDGFSGYGHTFNEIYDIDRKKWIFIDTFYSFFVTDSVTGAPLSVLEFRDRLRKSDTNRLVDIRPIDDSKFGFKDAEFAIQYYKRGSDQFYLWLANDVFSYDRASLVQVFGTVSRAAEQGIAIMAGIHPKFRIIESKTNRHYIESLVRVRSLALAQAAVFVCLLVLLTLSWRDWRRNARL